MIEYTLQMHIIIPFALFFGAVAILALTWLRFGRLISSLFDRCFPGRPTPQSIDPMLIDCDAGGMSSRFTLGPRSRSFSWPDRPGPFALNIIHDAKGQLLLNANGKTFTFGPVQKMWSDPVSPRYLFVPEPGDVVCFSHTISRFPWFIPYTFNVMGGAVPTRKRHAYDRLRWTKPSGATLEIIWRNEFWFYLGAGWCDVFLDRLYRVNIRRSPTK